MPYRKVLFIFSHDEGQYFAGWNDGVVGRALWSQEIDLARVYTSQNKADDDYETLKGMGLDVEVRG